MEGGGPGVPGPSQYQHRESIVPVQATSHGPQFIRSPTRRYLSRLGTATEDPRLSD